jgi:hypothetical protein
LVQGPLSRLVLVLVLVLVRVRVRVQPPAPWQPRAVAPFLNKHPTRPNPSREESG